MSRNTNTKKKIEKAFLTLLQDRELHEVTVVDIIKEAEINRSTFYVHYLDVYDLKDKITEKLYNELMEIYEQEKINNGNSYDFLKMLYHIKENQLYYKTMLKLKVDFHDFFNTGEFVEEKEKDALKWLGTTEYLDYHMEFFKSGMAAIMKKWLDDDCQISPEEIVKIIEIEYQYKM